MTTTSNKPIQYYIIPLFGLMLLFKSCLMYTFSGSSLNKEAQTFSIASFQSKVTLGPPNLTEQLEEKLRTELTQKTRLIEVNQGTAAGKEEKKHIETDSTKTSQQGDIRFEGVITTFQYTTVAPHHGDTGNLTSRRQLSVTVQVDYQNAFDKDFSFEKKNFTQTADTDSTNDITTIEGQLLDEILEKLIKDIFNASIANW